MKYKEWKEARQSEFNELPIFFAFSDKQFEEALAKRGVDLADAPKKVLRLPAGGFFLKKDKDIIHAFFEKDRDAELRGMMEADSDFALDAFEYEMMNHEYPINWQGDWDVCSCIGHCEYSHSKYAEDYLKELGISDNVIKMYAQARHKVQHALEW